LIEALRGQFSIWRLPGLPRVLALHLVAYAAAATVIGLWAGPYFADVHGLNANERGLALAAMGLAMPIGLLLVGPLERRFFRRATMISAGAALSAAMLLALPVARPTVRLLLNRCIARLHRTHPRLPCPRKDPSDG
jgi:predicted MFS family arabinose efflux permease